MRIALAADHAGFHLKEKLKAMLEEKGHAVTDFGAKTEDPTDDYPDFVTPAARAVASGECERGIILGGSGQGEALAANRMRAVRAVVYYGGNEVVLRLTREHNDANVLALGARCMNDDEAMKAVELWLATPFSGDERHIRRIQKIDTFV